MQHLKVGIDGRVEPVRILDDLVASDGRTLYFTIPDENDVVKHYDPSVSSDIKNVTISKKDGDVSVDVITATDHRLRFLDPKKHAAGHYDLLKEFHNERAIRNLFAKISMDDFLVQPRTELLRVMTRDKKVYVMHGGVVLSVGFTLRLTRVFGKVPDDRVVAIEVGSYLSTTVPFTYEKLLCPRRDLLFGVEEPTKEGDASASV